MNYVKGLFDGVALYVLISQLEIGVWYHDSGRIVVIPVFIFYCYMRFLFEA
jgi:hypothetical protein